MSTTPPAPATPAPPAEPDALEAQTDERAPTEPTLFWRACRVPVRVGATLLFDLQAFGADRVPRQGGALMISNHQSYLDPPLLGVRLERPMAYLARAELFKFGPFAWLIRNLNAFPVRQGRGDVGAMKESIRLLQAGWLLNMFPEGSRTPDGRLHPARLAARIGALAVRLSDLEGGLAQVVRATRPAV